MVNLFDLHTKQGVPGRKITELIRIELDACGMKSPRGGPWSDSTIRRGLKRHRRLKRDAKLVREEGVINNGARSGRLARELEELSKHDDPNRWPAPRRVGVRRPEEVRA